MWHFIYVCIHFNMPLTFAFLEHLLHVRRFPFQRLHMFPLFVLELAQLGGEGGGLIRVEK